MPHKQFQELRNRFRALFEDLYFTTGRDTWTNDPKDTIVKLRNDIIDLIYNRATEIVGITLGQEYFLLIEGPMEEQHTLARIQGDKIIQYTYFPSGWLSDQVKPTGVILNLFCPLTIKGEPFRITKQHDGHKAIVLKIEN